jgi:hypothetical protein
MWKILKGDKAIDGKMTSKSGVKVGNRIKWVKLQAL